MLSQATAARNDHAEDDRDADGEFWRVFLARQREKNEPPENGRQDKQCQQQPTQNAAGLRGSGESMHESALGRVKKDGRGQGKEGQRRRDGHVRVAEAKSEDVHIPVDVANKDVQRHGSHGKSEPLGRAEAVAGFEIEEEKAGLRQLKSFRPCR